MAAMPEGESKEVLKAQVLQLQGMLDPESAFPGGEEGAGSIDPVDPLDAMFQATEEEEEEAVEEEAGDVENAQEAVPETPATKPSAESFMTPATDPPDPPPSTQRSGAPDPQSSGGREACEGPTGEGSCPGTRGVSGRPRLAHRTARHGGGCPLAGTRADRGLCQDRAPPGLVRRESPAPRCRPGAAGERLAHRPPGSLGEYPEAPRGQAGGTRGAGEAEWRSALGGCCHRGVVDGNGNLKADGHGPRGPRSKRCSDRSSRCGVRVLLTMMAIPQPLRSPQTAQQSRDACALAEHPGHRHGGRQIRTDTAAEGRPSCHGACR